MYDYPVCQVLGHGAAEEHGQEATDQTGWTGQHSTRSEGRTPSVASDCNSDGGKAPARDLLAADDGADRPYHVAKAISGMMEDYSWMVGTLFRPVGRPRLTESEWPQDGSERSRRPD